VAGRILYGAIADDDTGASDLAGMLAEAGARTMLFIDLERQHHWEDVLDGYQAVVVGIGSRALPVAEARARTRAAAQALQRFHLETLHLKYCSTFDSTPEGNIGPAIEELMELRNTPFTVALPALPVNGRTTYQGYHFVHDKLLSESSMARHPLTPMTNPHLVSHLQSQTKRRVGLLPLQKVQQGEAAIREGLAQLRQQGVEIAILDCVSDDDLDALCRVLPDFPLITGSSAPAMRWRRFAWLRNSQAPVPMAQRAAARAGSGLLVVSGSCSPATLEQDARFAAHGAQVFAVEVEQLLHDASKVADDVVAPAARHIRAGHSVLLQTNKDRRFSSLAAGSDANSTGLRIATALAEIAARIMGEAPPLGLLSAGGETSSALCRRLALWALHVERNLCPGVPLCYALGEPPLPLVLKSGNFGPPDFYADVEAVLRKAVTP
jgi:3-dehydrotetronate 4-kinase